MNTFCCLSQTNKTATLRSRLPTVSISPIFFNMFVYLSAVLLPFVNLRNVGLAEHGVVMQCSLNILLVLVWCRLKQWSGSPNALTSLVIASTLITVRSLFPLIWIIRIILVKGLWCSLFSKLSLARCLQGIFYGDKFEVWLRQQLSQSQTCQQPWLVHSVASCSQTEGHGHCQRRAPVWAHWDVAVNLERQSKTAGPDLFPSCCAALLLMGVKYKSEWRREEKKKTEV